MKASSDTSAAPKRARVVRLDEPRRAILSVTGLLMVFGGMVALFLSDNAVGTAAAVITGAILFALGVIGLVPLRGKAGDLGWDFVDIAEEIADQTGAETAARIIEPIERVLSEEIRTAAHHRLDAVRRYESDVTDALERIIGQTGSIQRDIRHRRTGRYVDAEITIGDVRIWIDIKFVTDRRHAWRRVVEAIGSARLTGGRWLIVLNELPPSSIDDDQLIVVQWQSKQDDSALAAAVERVKGGPE